MKRTIVYIAGLVFIASFVYSAELEVSALPEIVTKCDLSNKNPNWIKAPQGKQIKDVVIPKDAGVSVEIRGSDAFLTFLRKVDQDTGETTFMTEPIKCFVVVDNLVYPIIGIPRATDGQTILLQWGSEKIEENLKFFEGLPIEKSIVKMTQAAMEESLPSTFSQTKIGKSIETHQDLILYHRKTIEAEGTGLILKEFVIAMKNTSPLEKVELQEKFFLIPEVTDKPIGITIEDFVVTKKQKTRLFIVERVNHGTMG